MKADTYSSPRRSEAAVVPDGTGQVGLARLLDEAPLRRGHIVVALLALAMLTLEGADIQLIGFVAPVIRQEWAATPVAFSLIFSAGLVGAMMGAMTFGQMGDRVGRRPICILATILFGMGTAASGLADGVTSLIAIRFVTGLGLGGVIPNALALTAELTPRARRAQIVSIVAIGLQAGGMVGAVLAHQFLATEGWRGTFFWMGGLSLAFVPLILAFLPESPRYLVARGAPTALVTRTIAPFIARGSDGATRGYVLVDDDVGRGRVSDLFRPHRASMTLLLWALFASNLFMTAFMVNWLPSLLKEAGLSLETALIATSLLNGGGVAGSLLLAPLIERAGVFRVLSVVYLLAAIVVGAVGLSVSSMPMLLIAVTLAGFFVIGPIAGINVAAAQIYPTSIRSTGVGWAFAIGRIGSIAGPLSAGVGLQAGLGTGGIFLICSAAGGVAACVSHSLSRRWRPDQEK